VYVRDLPLLTFRLNSRCLFNPHHVNQGGVQRRPLKSLFTRTTLLKTLSGDAELSVTVRYFLIMLDKRGNCDFVIKESPIACVDEHLVLHSCYNIPPITCVTGMTTSSCIPSATCRDPPHAPRPRCCPLSLQHHHIHCRLVPPECRLMYCQVSS
jgi:hypothetical protein